MYVEDECDHVLSLLLDWYYSKITRSTKVRRKSLGNDAADWGLKCSWFLQVNHLGAKTCVTKPGKPWHIPQRRNPHT